MSPQRSFRSKFIAITGVGILIGLIANVWVAATSLNTLGKDSANEIEKGLGQVIQEYLTNYIEDAAARINSIFRQSMAETKTLADIMQLFVDADEELEPLFRLLPTLEPFRHEMAYEPKGPWSQSTPGSPTVSIVYGSSLEPDGTIPTKIRRHIRRTAIQDFIMPPVLRNGSDKLQLYFVSPDDASVLRAAPYMNVGAKFAKYDTTPDKRHNKVPFWRHYFPGLASTWREWPTSAPERLDEYSNPAVRREMRQITVTPPYDDAAGGGLVMTLFHPLWTADRRKFDGALGVDVMIDKIIKDIETVALGQSGFAFLAQSNGNILAIKRRGLDVLKLSNVMAGSAGAQGLTLQKQYFKDSRNPAVAALKTPADQRVHFDELNIDGERYVLAMKRMGEFSLWHPEGEPYIRPEAWTLGFVVPIDEIYGALIASRSAIARTTSALRSNQLLIMLATLIIVLMGVYWVSRRMTTNLVSLSQAASRIMRKDYGVRVSINTDDEVGHLGRAFNEMANEISKYTHNLESLVEQRTSELKRANKEIRQLNEKLTEENLRLAAEIDVARRLQSMVLPQPDEFKEIEGLDIDGYMKPADEVGGDYYEVLKGPDGIKLGMGDVTGHGLESGVLMLMVQTAVRTLLVSGERDPIRFLNLINQTVYLNKQRMDVDRNLSLCLLDYQDGLLTVTGQHEDVIIVRADGKVELIDTTDLGFPIGLDLDIASLFTTRQFSISEDDTVILYTDGITEAENSANSFYGIDRLCKVAAKVHTKSAKEIREAIISDVTNYIDKQKVYDDITLLVIKKT
ncbi:MAG: SpoIIE family protein phosphatase [Proteobacteria bacterium]|nr:SpoIIE family protein phosphatase [Pseudomonadota bacterium]